MPVTDYLPASDAARVLWMQNFATKFAQFAVSLGFLPADVSNVNNDSLALANAIARNEATKQYARDIAAYKKAIIDGKVGGVTPAIPVAPVVAPPANAVNIGIIARVRALVNRVKAAPTYTENIGKDLDIIAPGDTPPNPATAQPQLIAGISGGKVVIKFIKAGYDGIQLETQRGAETDWSLLQTANYSPFIDPRPKVVANAPEVRRYRALYVKKNVPFGQYSGVESVLVP